MPNSAEILPIDRRVRQGGWLFIGTLLIFFVSSLLLYGIYASARLGDARSQTTLPDGFLISTVCLVAVSGLVHASTRTVRRSKRFWTAGLLSVSALAATIFMWIQFASMAQLISGPALQDGTGKGVDGMIVVLAFLHAVHVAGGVVSLLIVAVGAIRGRYDHERHWPVDFAANYWHFLDIVWLTMLAAFIVTTDGFAL